MHASVINYCSCIPACGACNYIVLIVDLFDIWTLSFKTNITEKLILCLCSVDTDVFGQTPTTAQCHVATLHERSATNDLLAYPPTFLFQLYVLIYAVDMVSERLLLTSHIWRCRDASSIKNTKKHTLEAL